VSRRSRKAFGIALAAAEGLVRGLFPHTRDGTMPGHLIVIDDDLGWKMRAERRTRHQTRYFAVEYDASIE
jgi:hypothetical protein